MALCPIDPWVTNDAEMTDELFGVAFHRKLPPSFRLLLLSERTAGSFLSVYTGLI